MEDRHVMHSLGKCPSASARRTSSVRGVDQSPGQAVRSSRRASKGSFFIFCQEIVRQFAELALKLFHIDLFGIGRRLETLIVRRTRITDLPPAEDHRPLSTLLLVVLVADGVIVPKDMARTANRIDRSSRLIS
jgi:hypothetical protein